MSKQTILITIDDEGISVDGQGFQGNGCVTAVSRVMRRLGVQGKLEKKPDYHRNRVSGKQEIKQKA